MNLTDSEKLALLVALDKRVKPQLGEMKDSARQSLIEAQAQDGTDRRAIMVGGTKVGEVGVSYSKAAPYIRTERMADAISCLAELGLVETVPAKGWESHFTFAGGKVICTDTGEAVEWAGWEPSRAKTAAIRGCKPEDVMEAFGERLSTVDPIALIGGE